MSILIKDMKMPQNCYECPFEKDVFYNRSDDTICAITRKMTGINKCPLVEIPPHGRLIDADKLTERLDGIWDCNDMVFEDDNICDKVHADCNSCRWRETRDFIKDRVIKRAPTIIDAEEEQK